MAKFFPMFSGSGGNSSYIGDSEGGVVVDIGVSYKRFKTALASADIPLEAVKAVLITHEHTDHVKGLKVFLKNNPVPVIASRETVYALEFAGIMTYETPRIYLDGEDYELDGIRLTRFATSHDCVGSSGYVIELAGGTKVAVCTDLGVMTDCIKDKLCGCDLVMLESNHDPVMLRLGPYPAELKLRIASEKGHLPNAVCAETLAHLYEKGTCRFVLAHISKENNTPEKAASAARAALMDKGAKEGRDYALYIAEPEGSRIIPL